MALGTVVVLGVASLVARSHLLNLTREVQGAKVHSQGAGGVREVAEGNERATDRGAQRLGRRISGP